MFPFKGKCCPLPLGPFPVSGISKDAEDNPAK